MYTIRPATEQDQAAIRSLIRQVGINPHAPVFPPRQALCQAIPDAHTAEDPLGRDGVPCAISDGRRDLDAWGGGA
jgi:hypothetical protein